MKAETAYNVIQALPESEVSRLYQMLGIKATVKPAKKKPVVTNAEAREYLLKKFTR